METSGIKKVVVIGPESTGKSILCERLAKYYNTLWCPEYAREFLMANGNKYFYADLLTIAKGQIELEGKYILLTDDQWQMAGQWSTDNRQLFFIDTNMYVMKVWSEFVFGKCSRYILDQIMKRKYDLYLLCNTDLPWVKDELREYPDPETRQKLFTIYKNIMENQSIPWVEISGNYDQRLQKAVTAVDALLKN